jgi:hypothetical protein
MDKERVNRITVCIGIAARRIGRTTVKWEDDVREDPGKTEIQNWSKMAEDRKTWRRIVEQDKTRKYL